MSAPLRTADLAERLGEARARIPAPVLRAARLHLLDALAVGLLGAARGPVRGVTALASGAGPSSVLGSGRSAPPAVAALVNGSLIHSLEFDDTHVPSVMHGSSVLAPAALAAAEESGASGTDLLTAYATGWELLVRIGLASPGRVQARGFQITSAGGPFAAAAVSSLLHGDPPTVTAHALGIAGSQAGGTFAFLADGATVKAAQPGLAAHAGLVAAELARAGVTGPSDVFGGRYGFYSLYADDPSGGERLAELCADLGEVWHLPRAAFKLLPCCHYIHPFVEALGTLAGAGLTRDTLAELHCWVPAEVVPVVADPWPARQRPPAPHDARWSLPYVLAAVLADGALDVGLFEGQRCREDLMALTARMTYEPWDASGYPARFPARLRARLVDGTVLEAEVDDVRGGVGRPVSEAGVREKAHAALMAAGLSGEAARAVATEVLDAPDPDLVVLASHLRRAGDADGGIPRAGVPLS